MESRSSADRFVSAAHGLQFKATMLVVALTLCVTAAVTGYLLQSGITLVQRQHREQLVQSTAMLGMAAGTPYIDGDTSGLSTLAADVANGHPLLYVVFSQPDGKELAAAESRNSDLLKVIRNHKLDGDAMLGTPVFHPATEHSPGFLDVVYPIRARANNDGPSSASDTELLGYVRAGMTDDRWYRGMASKLDLVIGVGTLATAVAVALGFLLVRRIVSPLEGLAAAMLEFSRGKLDIRSKVRRKDEIGQLANAFNRMADQHQQNHERLVRLNTELEDRVAKRTRQLKELASRDPLTGIHNRRHFAEVLEQRFSEAVRYDNDLSCIMLDVDNFKSVNDRFGHQTGDRLLNYTARIISEQLRTADVLARYGGDEFIVLLPQSDGENAHVLGRRILEAFVLGVAGEFPEASVTLSIGIASVNAIQPPDAEALIRSADRALYEAKSQGKNCLVAALTVAESTSL